MPPHSEFSMNRIPEMSSPCISGGGGSRTYGFDLEIVKSPSTSTIASSPSSTLSESSNSPLAISTRKPRTPRKRPNQTYNEAAALLSTAYPNIFSTNNLSNPCKFTKPHHHQTLLLDESSSELLWPFRVFDDSGFLLHQNTESEKPSFSFLNETKVSNLINSSEKSSSSPNSMELGDGYEEDLDAESILDEEIEEGIINSIMGNLSVSKVDEELNENNWYRNQIGANSLGNYGIRRGVRALRHRNEGTWWNFPIVDMLQISPQLQSSSNNNGNKVSNSNSDSKIKLKIAKSSSGDKIKLKNKNKAEKPAAAELNKEIPTPEVNSGLQLKLNYDDVLKAWSDRGSAFTDELSGSEGGNDVSVRLAQIDLFAENGVREASVLRYKEKRRSRLFFKKIRYQVRKVNADRRPRMKGRFVRRSNSGGSSQRREE